MKHEITLDSGAKVITEIRKDQQGEEVVVHYVINPKGIKSVVTCTCTCPNGTSASTTCATGNSITCDCTGSAPKLSCN